MNPAVDMERPHALSLLRNFARKRAGMERCELCAAEISQEHQHLFEPVKRRVVCACDACSILFSSGGQTKLKRIPRRVVYLPGFQMTSAQWDGLMIPINMAFLFGSTPENRVVALYPSPAGAIESTLTLDHWNDILLANPVLSEMQDDVEALLVNRIAHSRDEGPAEYFITPIDECFKLVGLIRGSWRGFSGGTEVWRAIDKFFDGLKERTCRI